MTAGGGASWATAGCMTQAGRYQERRADNRKRRTQPAGSQFHPIHCHSPDSCRCAHSMSETYHQAKRQEPLGISGRAFFSADWSCSKAERSSRWRSRNIGLIATVSIYGSVEVLGADHDENTGCRSRHLPVSWRTKRCARCSGRRDLCAAGSTGNRPGTRLNFYCMGKGVAHRCLRFGLGRLGTRMDDRAAGGREEDTRLQL